MSTFFRLRNKVTHLLVIPHKHHLSKYQHLLSNDHMFSCNGTTNCNSDYFTVIIYIYTCIFLSFYTSLIG